MEWVNELLDRNRDTSGSVYPASRGREQYSWEPPRVTVEKPSYDRSGAGGSVYEDGGNMEGGGESLSEERSTQTGDIRGTDPSDDEERVEETRVLEPRSRNEVEPEMGRDVDGASNGVGYAKLYESFDNRTDELRMLGNGVVPDTARRAFTNLWRELVNSPSFTER